MTTQMLSALTRLSDHALLVRVKHLAAVEREATVALIAHLTELDARQLYLGEGYPSLFAYCTRVLRLSEHATYGRIEAARAARRFPIILDLLEEGSITLTTVCLLGPHLTEENHRAVLEAARHCSKRQVEELVARLHPQPPVPPSVRRLPTPRSAVVAPGTDAGMAPGSEACHSDEIGSQVCSKEGAGDAQPATSLDFALGACSCEAPAAKPTAMITPLAPERYKVQFTASAQTHEKLRRAQALLRHQIPDGDPAAILDRALTVLLEQLERQKLAATNRPRPDRLGSQAKAHVRNHVHERSDSGDTLAHSRHIPAAVRRAVWQRDGGQCAFVSAAGRRCPEQGFLEFHHVVPFSLGGPPSVENIELRCRAHNGFEAEIAFGMNRGQVREMAAVYAATPASVISRGQASAASLDRQTGRNSVRTESCSITSVNQPTTGVSSRLTGPRPVAILAL